MVDPSDELVTLDPEPGEAHPAVVPVSELSRKPLRDKPGFYAGDGLSPYATAFLQPASNYLKDQLPEESLYDYVKRMRHAGVNVREYLDEIRVAGVEETDNEADGPKPAAGKKPAQSAKKQKGRSVAAAAVALFARPSS